MKNFFKKNIKKENKEKIDISMLALDIVIVSGTLAIIALMVLFIVVIVHIIQ